MSNRKKIVIAGGTGFLGTALAHHFAGSDCEVVILTRSENDTDTSDKHTHKNLPIERVTWDASTLGDWTQYLEGVHALINLCGKSVDCRYTAQNKREIIDSRVRTTQLLNRAVGYLNKPPRYFLNSSTATIYVHSETQLNTEQNGTIGDDFSMNVAKKWETAFFAISFPEVQKIALRTSIVLGNTEGALPVLKKITRLGLGGKAGPGSQKISWIHISDFCSAVEFLINSTTTGPVNITAPIPTTNAEFMKSLRTILKVSFGIPQPKWLLELGAIFINTETELLLKSRNVYPEKLLESGFDFKYDKIHSALNALCN